MQRPRVRGRYRQEYKSTLIHLFWTQVMKQLDTFELLPTELLIVCAVAIAMLVTVIAILG